MDWNYRKDGIGMFLKNTKRIISLGLSFILALVLASGVIPSEKVYAASFSDINQDTMFLNKIHQVLVHWHQRQCW